MTDGLADGEKIAIASTSSHPKRSPTGIWSRIVCGDCEKSFGNDDEYLIWFYRTINHLPSALNGEATELRDVDALKLRRSILSVVYRAHLSDHEAFISVDLGPHKNDLRKFIFDKESNLSPNISVALRHLTSPTGEALLSPTREKFEGINTYRFYFPRFTAIIRFDKRTNGYPFLNLELGRTQPAYAMRFEKFSTSEMRALARVIERYPEAIKRTLGIKN